ncbi:MAG: hypothetical protein ACOYOU_12005 [Kiritimatiellia bacterium]
MHIALCVSARDNSDWQAVDVQAHHNTCCPKETIGGSTSYTELLALDEQHLLYQ